MYIPSLNLEGYLLSKGYIVAGIDEVGRGAIAGPVVASVVVMTKPIWIVGVRDSKLLTERQREKLAVEIKRYFSFGYGVVENSVIDKYGIRFATYLAMQKALNSLKLKPDYLLVDGVNTVIKFSNYNAFYYSKGDQRIASISYASIIAKVYRDNLMKKLSTKYPVYRWDKNKGYGTKEHKRAIKNYGISSYHRRTFLANILGNNE